MGRGIEDSLRASSRREERVGSRTLPLVRLLVAGTIGGGVIHEFANLLTVIDGNRQMAEMGLARRGTDRTREPLERSRTFVEAYRYVFGSADPAYDVAASLELDAIATLVRVKLRGQPGRVEARIPRPDDIMIPRRVATGVRFCFLAAVFGILDSLEQASVVELSVGGAVGGAVGGNGDGATSLEAVLRGRSSRYPVAADAPHMLSAAESLAMELRALLQWTEIDGETRIRLVIPS